MSTDSDRRQLLRRFLRGETSPQETAALVRAALLAGPEAAAATHDDASGSDTGADLAHPHDDRRRDAGVPSAEEAAAQDGTGLPRSETGADASEPAAADPDQPHRRVSGHATVGAAQTGVARSHPEDHAAALDTAQEAAVELGGTVAREESQARELVAELAAAVSHRLPSVVSVAGGDADDAPESTAGHAVDETTDDAASDPATDPVAPLEATVRREARFHTWAVAEGLRDACLDACLHHPARAVALGRLAVVVSEELAEGAEGGAEDERLRSDLLALALAHRGNAERVAARQRDADASLRAALDAAERGTGDRLVRARLLTLLASLRSDQSRFDEAVDAARRAAHLYRLLDDHHTRGRTLLKLATYHAYRDELDTARQRVEQALSLVDPGREPRLLFAAHHNLASYLERLGRSDEAAAELATARELCEAPLDRLRCRWLAGRLARGRGETAAAEAIFNEVRREFVEREMGYDAAQVSLELAALYAEQGRTAEVRRAAEAMVPLFAARDVHPEARAALALYLEAARTEEAGASLARDLLRYLERARHQPGLKFDPS